MQQNGNIGDLVDSELNNPQPADNGPAGNQACQQQQHTLKHACKHIYNFIYMYPLLIDEVLQNVNLNVANS